MIVASRVRPATTPNELATEYLLAGLRLVESHSQPSLIVLFCSFKVNEFECSRKKNMPLLFW